jgi:hypothetical protein
MIKPSQQDSRISGTRGSSTQGRRHIKRKICQKYNASTVKNMVTTSIIVPSSRKGRRHMKHQLLKKRNLQRRLIRMKQTSSSKDKVTILLLVLVHILFS